MLNDLLTGKMLPKELKKRQEQSKDGAAEYSSVSVVCSAMLQMVCAALRTVVGGVLSGMVRWSP